MTLKDCIGKRVFVNVISNPGDHPFSTRFYGVMEAVENSLVGIVVDSEYGVNGQKKYDPMKLVWFNTSASNFERMSVE